MAPLNLALKYMEYVFETGDMEELRNILCDDLDFNGLFFSFSTADSYVDSLLTDPPVGFKYEIKKTYSNSTSACLIYKFSKPNISTTMAQTFDILNGKIKSILLIFDTGAF